MFTEDLTCTERIRKLKDDLFSEPRYMSVEQAALVTESYRLHAHEPRILQRAKAFAHAAKHIAIRIEPAELIVGNRTAGVRAGVVFPESGIDWIEAEIDELSTRPQDRFNVRERDKEIFLEQIVPFWKGKTLENRIKDGREGDEIKAIEKVVKINQKDHAQGHILPDVVSWLEMGPAGLRKQVEVLGSAASDSFTSGSSDHSVTASPEQLVSATIDPLPSGTRDSDRKHFYQAQSIVLEAASDFMLRYADLARHMASREENITEARHLEQIATTCSRLSERPAETFHEALQSTWFLFVLLQMESNASSFSPGRMDQYLLPYYLQEKEAGQLDDQQALELIEALWLKFNQIVYMRNKHSASFFAGFPIGFNVAIGGQDRKGRSAVNQLSYLMLKAQEHIGLPQPNLSARLFRDAPDEFIRECARVIGKGSGMPQLLNDEAVIPALANQGISKEDAMNYGVVGCVELSTHGNNLGWSDAAMFNMVKVIELTLNDGVCLLTGQQLGLNTGTLDSFDTYAHFEDALEQQMNYFIERMMACCAFVDQTHARILPSPFLSSVIRDCLQKGLDVTAGGATYNFSGIQFIQVANVADSLATIKSAVFEDKVIAPGELLNCLRNNFKGHAEMKLWITDQLPKYGNDVEWVDALGLKWAKKFAEKISIYTNARGGTCHTGFYTVSAHVPMGKQVGASADGRLAEEPLADGGMSAVYGRDVKGPTALLKSVSRIDSMLGSNGTLLNMKFMPEVFRNDRELDKFISLLKALIRLKITHVQFNVVSKEDLVEAQKNPEAYRDLTIRVAGYTAYFVELSEDLQNEIIERTEYGAW